VGLLEERELVEGSKCHINEKVLQMMARGNPRSISQKPGPAKRAE